MLGINAYTIYGDYIILVSKEVAFLYAVGLTLLALAFMYLANKEQPTPNWNPTGETK